MIEPTTLKRPMQFEQTRLNAACNSDRSLKNFACDSDDRKLNIFCRMQSGRSGLGRTRQTRFRTTTKTGRNDNTIEPYLRALYIRMVSLLLLRNRGYRVPLSSHDRFGAAPGVPDARSLRECYARRRVARAEWAVGQNPKKVGNVRSQVCALRVLLIPCQLHYYIVGPGVVAKSFTSPKRVLCIPSRHVCDVRLARVTLTKKWQKPKTHARSPRTHIYFTSTQFFNFIKIVNY